MKTNEPTPLRPWPEGHAEFAAYCDANPEHRNNTPFGWFAAGLRAGRAEMQEAIEAARARGAQGQRR